MEATMKLYTDILQGKVPSPPEAEAKEEDGGGVSGGVSGGGGGGEGVLIDTEFPSFSSPTSPPGVERKGDEEFGDPRLAQESPSFLDDTFDSTSHHQPPQSWNSAAAFDKSAFDRVAGNTQRLQKEVYYVLPCHEGPSHHFIFYSLTSLAPQVANLKSGVQSHMKQLYDWWQSSLKATVSRAQAEKELLERNLQAATTSAGEKTDTMVQELMSMWRWLLLLLLCRCG